MSQTYNAVDEFKTLFTLVSTAAAMAAQIAAIKAVVDAGVSLSGDVHIAGVADEEFARRID